MSGNTDKAEEFFTLHSYPKAIAHIDCDAFFASCEEARDPSLRGRPVVTGKERGIIACANYKAKALGIKRGVSLRDAKLLCPELVILPGDYEMYSVYSERMFEIIRRFTPTVEEFSIDEAFCDLTGLRRLYRTSYQEIALRIKDAIHKELDITVSVGLSLTKTLAKICSRHKKPDGFTPAPGCELHSFLKGIPLDRVCGFGPNTVSLLNKCGICDVFGYAEKSFDFADRLLGKVGRELWQELRGIQVYGISAEKKEKYLSISKTKTFSPASSDRALVKAHLMRNLESAFIKLRRHKLSAKALSIYLRTRDFKGMGLSGELDRHSFSTLDFTQLCGRMFDKVFEEGVVYRATGVVLSDIVLEGADSMTLFDDPVKIARISGLSKAVDEINGQYGKYAVHLASSDQALSVKRPHSRNDTAWRKTTLLKGETFRRRLRLPLLKTAV
ncbi:MAG: DNA polymerase IV [Candidatus Omnitrophota bacterium]|nr:DNA polymerase IV [Candidatus Omnitrophota bacterium]